MKNKRSKPTVKQLGSFVLNVYEKVRQVERIAMGNSQAFLQYLEMTDQIDKFNEYLKEKVNKNDGETTEEHKKRKAKQAKGSRASKASGKPSKKLRTDSTQQGSGRSAARKG